jgi:hypothetical protein
VVELLATLCVILANDRRKRDAPAFTLEDFLPWRQRTAAVSGDAETEIKAVLDRASLTSRATTRVRTKERRPS